MKKIFLTLFCGVIIIFSLFACDKNNDKEPKAPDWRALITEYDAWADEYVIFQTAYRADPTDTELISQLEGWASQLEGWTKKTNDMFNALYDYPSEKNEFTSELSRITKKIVEGITDDVTDAEINALLDEYDAWADDYVAFFEIHKDDRNTAEFNSELTVLMTEMAEWTQKVNDMSARIKDSNKLASFSSKVAVIAEKVASAYN